jgi:serine/threonine protein kinase
MKGSEENAGNNALTEITWSESLPDRDGQLRGGVRDKELTMAEPQGKRFGRYEVVAELGRGAMGLVYKARDPQIDRLVAVKTVFLDQEAEEHSDFRGRFLNEAQAAGRLHHAGIVAIFDFGEDPETNNPYIVLEYVAGESLNRILGRERKLPLATALKLAEEIARALDYAHEQGVIHRDVKPANILVTQDGHAKVADFGIAKLNLAHFTLPGHVMGTPAYMAPEQLSGEGTDGRSDLFSLGAILYAMVTGHSPFQGDSATAVCFKVSTRDPVAASALELGLPRALDDVITRALAKDPGERFQRGAQFADALHQLREQLGAGLTTTSLHKALAVAVRPVDLGFEKSNPITARVLTGAKDVPRTAVWMLALVAAAMFVMLLIAAVHSGLWVDPPKVIANAVAPVSVSKSDVSSHTPEIKPAETKPTEVARKVQTARHAQTTLAAPAPTRVAVRSAPAPPIVTEVVQPFSMLDLAVQHPFKDGTLFVWLDDQQVLTRALHGETQKRMGVFKEVRGVESETLKIPSGHHFLRVRVLSADQTIDLSKTVPADFVGGDDRSLQVTLDKHNTIHLAWQ